MRLPPATAGRPVLHGQELGHLRDPLAHRRGRDPVLLVVGDLDRAAAIGLRIAARDRVGLLVGVHEDPSRRRCGRRRPMVWTRLVSPRRKPSLSASRIATRETSGRSSPSRRRLTPTSTSYSPRRRSRMIWIRSRVSISECGSADLDCPVTRAGRLVRSSAIFLVSVVTRTRSPGLGADPFGSRSSGRRSGSSFFRAPGSRGRRLPVGRTICSTIRVDSAALERPRRRRDHPPVGEPGRGNSVELERPVVRSPRAAGTRSRPASSSATYPPSYIPPIWGIVWWDSSTKTTKSSGK